MARDWRNERPANFSGKQQRTEIKRSLLTSCINAIAFCDVQTAPLTFYYYGRRLQLVLELVGMSFMTGALKQVTQFITV